MTSFSLLSAVSEDGDSKSTDTFFRGCRMRVLLKRNGRAVRSCLKPYKTLKMRNLSDFNDIYNIQDVYILSVILENRYEMKRKNEMKQGLIPQ